jgi:uncharacterized protein YggE
MFRSVLPLALAALMALAPAAEAESPPPSISVGGVGEVAAAPDMAVVTIGVREQADTAAGALAANSAAMNRVFEALEALGVERRDIQTVNLSLNQIYRQVRVEDRIEQRPDGFQAANMVRIRLRELAMVGPGLDALVTAGANEMHGIAFDIAEKDALLDQARAAAVRDARRKAELYAEAAGVALGGVLSLSEASQGVIYPRADMLAMAREAGPPVAEGEQTISASVQMVFAIAE